MIDPNFGTLRGLLDQSRYFFETRFLDGTARAVDHDHVVVGARGIERSRSGLMILSARHERPAPLHPPGRMNDSLDGR
jgi:hypothetical protein